MVKKIKVYKIDAMTGTNPLAYLSNDEKKKALQVWN
jgi:hypothetical protein